MRERLLVLVLGERVDRAELLAAARPGARCARAARPRASSSSASAAGSAGSPRRSASSASSWSASAAWSRACWARTSAAVTSSPRSRRRRWISASSPAQARSRAARSSPAARSAASSASSALDAHADRLHGACERRRESRGLGLERAIGGEPVAQAVDPAGAVGALALGALGDAPLGGELAVELRAAPRPTRPAAAPRGAWR